MFPLAVASMGFGLAVSPVGCVTETVSSAVLEGVSSDPAPLVSCAVAMATVSASFSDFCSTSSVAMELSWAPAC